MQDLLGLVRLCNVLPGRITEAAHQKAVETTKRIARDVIDHTPVDTTEHASNWQVEIAAKPLTGFDAIFPGSQGSTASQSRNAAYDHVVRSLTLKDPGVVIYLSNLGPAIEDLNNGTSKQEPAGMVQRAIRVGQRYAASSGLEIKL